ncbi:hypothetical protein GGI07_004360 [Coemansia sp. Benny D115]|nr:hypothetical protein GGI07_004360 [Coemansia sp. Benny D115]
MRIYSAIAAAVSVLAVASNAAPVASDLNQFIGEPLLIFVQSGTNKLVTALIGDDQPKSSAQHSSTAPATSTAPKSPASSTHEQQASTVHQQQQSSSSSSSSSASQAPAPSSAPEQGATDNGIPTGQGNNFNTPSGAVRFPWNYGNSDNVVPITPGSSNGGWAMSPDQQCRPNSWCPYACAPGFYSAQWDPSAALYNGKGSMNGGLYADGSGKLSKPFPDRPFCSAGMFNANIKNTLGQPVSACQTVYPGNEAMIIPSVAQPGGTVPLNIVPSSYWLGTSSQFYVNLAGSTGEQCIWGNADKPIGNWAPYIFGGGQGKDGNTYISVQYNPLYSSVGFNKANAYNVRIECVSGNCNFPAGGQCKCEGGSCSVDNGCTVTLSQGAKANFVIY